MTANGISANGNNNSLNEINRMATQAIITALEKTEEDQKMDPEAAEDWRHLQVVKSLNIASIANHWIMQDNVNQPLSALFPKQEPTLLTSKASAEQGLKIIGTLLTTSAKEYTELFGIKIEHLRFLTIEQLIQIGWMLILIHSHQGRQVDSERVADLLQSLSKREWQYVGGNETLVKQFEKIWDHLKIENGKRVALKKQVSLVKQLASCPSCFKLKVDSSLSVTTPEAYQYLAGLVQQLGNLFLPIYAKAQTDIEAALNDIRLGLREKRRSLFVSHSNCDTLQAGVWVKEIAVYQRVSDWFRAVYTHSSIYSGRIKRGNLAHAFDRGWSNCLQDGRQIMHSLQQIDTTLMQFMEWCSVFSPTGKMPDKVDPFFRKYFQDIKGIESSISKHCMKVIQRYVQEHRFKKENGEITGEKLDKVYDLSFKILDVLADFIDTVAAGKTVKKIDRKVAALKEKQPEATQSLITDLFTACQEGLADVRKQHLALRERLLAVCPYGGNPPFPLHCIEDQLKLTVNMFRVPQNLKARKAKSEEGSNYSIRLTSRMFATFESQIGYINTVQKSETVYQKFLQDRQSVPKEITKASDEEELDRAILYNILEQSSMCEIPQRFAPLADSTELLCSQLLPLVDMCQKALPQTHNTIQAEEDDSWWFAIADQMEAPLVEEADSKETQASTHAKNERKKRKLKTQVQSKTSIEPAPAIVKAAPAQPTEAETKLNCDMRTHFLHSVGCVWGIKRIAAPITLCAAPLDLAARSKYEYLHAMHRFHLVDQMLQHTKDSTVQSILALRYMHLGFLANEQCLVSTGTAPSHRLSIMMTALGIKCGLKWDQLADCGAFVARYSGFHFDSTATQEELIKDILTNREQWIQDAYTLQKAALAKHSGLKELLPMLETLKSEKLTAPSNDKKGSQRYLKMVDKLKEVATSFDTARKAIVERMDSLRKSPEFVEKQMFKRLQTIENHLALLSGLPAKMLAHQGPECWVEHADEALLHAMYIADNLGTFLALSKFGVNHIDIHHYLGTFMTAYQLGTGLENEPKEALEQIQSIGKGSELPYGYSVRHTQETASVTMVLCSDLYDLSKRLIQHGEGFIPVGGRALRPDQLEERFLKHMQAMMQLSHALANKHLL